MKHSKKTIIISVVSLIILATFAAFKLNAYSYLKHTLKLAIKNPNIAFEKTSPEEIGLPESAFSGFKKIMKETNSKAVIVLKNDKIVFEWYKTGYHYNDKLGLASLSKLVVGTSSLLLALDDNLFDLQDYAYQYIEEWQNDSAKSKIKILNLATFSSGIENSREVGTSHGDESGWKKEYWEKSDNRIIAAINKAPMIFEPGSKVKYSNPAVTSLGYIIAKQIKQIENKKLPEYLFNNLYKKLEIPKSDFSISYGKSFNYDSIKIYEIGGGGLFTPRAVARIGQFFLHKGKWNNEQIIDENLITQAMTYQLPEQTEIMDGFPAPGLLGWTNNKNLFSNLPKDAFIGLGANHEVLLIVPSMNLIAVRFGDPLNNIHWANYAADENTEMVWKDLENYFINPLMEIFK